MDQKNDRDLFKREANWIVFVFLIVILTMVNFVLLLLPISPAAKSVILDVSLVINFIFWIDSFYWLRKLPGRRYLTEYHGTMAFIGNLPFFTPLRLLQIFLFYRKLRQLNMDIRSEIAIRRNSKGVLLLFCFVAIVVFEFSAVFILNAEIGAPNANILDADDALWWSIVTVATVGYGDLYPVTDSGRSVAVLLMIVGIAMFGIFTSTLGDWFRRPRQLRDSQKGSNEENSAVTVEEMRKLLEEQNLEYQRSIAELTEKINELEQKI
jgi:voltage-gated potassium channel